MACSAIACSLLRTFHEKGRAHIVFVLGSAPHSVCGGFGIAQLGSAPDG
jgi:hypothetical protein